MNFYTQICGLIIIILLLFFYRRQPILGLKSEQQFQKLLYVVLGCICLDIASCFTIIYSERFPETVVVAIARLYLCALCSVAFYALRYTVTDIYDKVLIRNLKFKKYIYRALYAVISISILFLPINFYHDDVSLYTSGPATIATYMGCFLFILTIMIESFVHKNYIKPKRRSAILFWMIIWIVAASLQFFYPKHLIVGFAACIGMLVIFFEMENPEASISRRTGHFSSAVIRDYFDYQYLHRHRFSVLMISFTTVADSTQDTQLLRQSINSLSEFLFTLKDTKVFDTPEGYFILVFDNSDFIESTKFKINNYFQSVEDSTNKASAITLLNPFYTIVPDSYITTNSDELLALLTGFVPSNHKNYEGNEIIVDESSISNLRANKHVEDMVIDAMEHDRVEVFYQPIYNVKKKLFTTAEGLVRIRLADGNIVQPSTFIPIVEETGRIIPLSDAIYRKALSFMKNYHLERLGIDYIELNLSVKQGESPVFATRFKDMLASYDIPGDMVNLEITETSSMLSKENILNNMSKLSIIGVTFSLDDFGSGSSNLNYIIDMPVKTVKLDKTLTDAYFDNVKAEAIVKAVIEMAHSIGIEIIAEGIETPERFETMVDLGVDYIQGYYFSRPLPEREFLAFIQNNNLK